LTQVPSFPYVDTDTEEIFEVELRLGIQELVGPLVKTVD